METVLSPALAQAVYPISEASEIPAARRAGSELANRLGFDDTRIGKVALVITEAATNILKHGDHGSILLRPLERQQRRGVEVLALDAGPGMANLPSSMMDGVSTAGSYGVGLGAMARIADEFDIYTASGKGTAIMAVIWDAPPEPASVSWDVGAVCLPLPSETACGDAWALATGPTLATLMVADGLGHGTHAAEASGAALEVLKERPDAMPGDLLHDAHGALRSTRGAAIAVVRVDTLAEELVFAGIGNISASVFQDGGRRQMISHNGIVGSNMRKVQEFTLPWSEQALLVLHSDGVGTRWDLKQYPGLEMRHPSLIAAVLYRDFTRGRDDASIVVLCENRSGRQ